MAMGTTMWTTMAMVVAAGMTMTVGHTHNNQLKAAAEEMMLSPNAENCNDDGVDDNKQRCRK